MCPPDETEGDADNARPENARPENNGPDRVT